MIFLRELKISVPLIALAKKEEEIYLARRRFPLRLSKTSEALKLLQRIRDEAHRFAISYYAREHRQKTFTSALDEVPGIGPKLGMEFCAIPTSLILRAVQEQDANMLKGVKGVGKKTAEKLLVELKSLLEKSPVIFGTPDASALPHEFDQDAIAALTILGYDSPAAIDALKRLPPELKSTEERVEAALRSL